MTVFHSARALGVLAMTLAANPALADIKAYKFELVDTAVKAGRGTQFTVRLLNSTTGKVVPDAVIFATRLDMAPEGMEGMMTRIAVLPDAEPGLYRFDADFSMAGTWQLTLSAKVQGEAETLVDKLTIQAQP